MRLPSCIILPIFKFSMRRNAFHPVENCRVESLAVGSRNRPLPSMVTGMASHWLQTSRKKNALYEIGGSVRRVEHGAGEIGIRIRGFFKIAWHDGGDSEEFHQSSAGDIQ